MNTKYIIAFGLLVAGVAGATLALSLSRRLRGVFFFLMVTLSTVTTAIDVNFVSREWYRGTTCGYEVSVVDIIAFSLCASLILRPASGYRRWYWPASLGFMLLLFGYAVFSVAVNEPKLFGMFALSKMVRGLIVFLAAALFVRGERELRLFILGLGTAVCYQAFEAVLQRYHYGIHRVFGTLDDSNSLSMYMCLAAPVFVAVITSNLPRYFKILSSAAIALACGSVILTISRTGVLAIGLVLLLAALATMSYTINPRKIFFTLVIMAGVAGVVVKSWESLSERFSQANFREEVERSRSQGRGYYFRLAKLLSRDHLFGVGPNNWSYWVSNKYGPKLGFKFAPYPGTDKRPKFEVRWDANVDDPQAAPAHSLLALTLGEMGLIGVVIFALVWLRWFQMGASFLLPRTPDPMRRLAVGIFFGTWGIFLQSMTEWVFHQTAIFFTFNIFMGVLASLYHVKKMEKRAERAQRAEQAALEEELYWRAQRQPAAW